MILVYYYNKLLLVAVCAFIGLGLKAKCYWASSVYLTIFNYKNSKIKISIVL